MPHTTSPRACLPSCACSTGSEPSASVQSEIGRSFVAAASGGGYTRGVPEPITSQDRVLVTVTGRDRPGVTALLSEIIVQKGAVLTDIEQVVVQGQLTLCLLVDLPRSSDVLKELLFAAKQLGMSLDFNPVSAEPAASEAEGGSGPRYVITAIARSLGASHIHAIASTLAGEGANIEKISRLSEGALASVEIHATLPPSGDPDRLKRSLLGVAMRSSFDVALQREGLFRRSKRLVVMDMDSTLIRIEVIDELARAAGVYERVAAITERAMQGEMNYDESLRQRVALPSCR
jgi:phosphoserine phosphatase